MLELETLDKEVESLLEEAKRLYPDANVDINLNEVSHSDFSRVTNAMGTILKAVHNISFASSYKYRRDEELLAYKKFFAENKTGRDTRVMTYPGILEKEFIKINSTALVSYVKESIRRHSLNTKEIDVTDVQQRSIAFMYKSMTGRGLSSETMTRQEFTSSINYIIKGYGKIFVKINSERILRHASVLPNTIAYIDNTLLLDQVKILKAFADEYSSKMLSIAEEHPEDFDLGKEVTKYKAILENAVYDMLHIYKSVRNLYINLNDEYYSVLKAIKKTYRRDYDMNEQIKVDELFEQLLECTLELESYRNKCDVGLLSESAIGDKIKAIRDKVSKAISEFGSSINKARKVRRADRERVAKYNSVVKKVTMANITATEKISMYEVINYSAHIRLPFSSGDKAYLTRMLNSNYSPSEMGRYTSSDLAAFKKENDEMWKKEKASFLESLVASPFDKNGKMTVESASKVIKAFYLGDKKELVPNLVMISSNMKVYEAVLKAIDTKSYYEVYKLALQAEQMFKRLVDESMSSAVAETVTHRLNGIRDYMSFMVGCINCHYDCIVTLADSSYRILKNAVNEDPGDLTLPNIMRESYEGLMFESVTGEDPVPSVEDTMEDDVEVMSSDIPPSVELYDLNTGEITPGTAEVEADEYDPSINGDISEAAFLMMCEAFEAIIDGGSASYVLSEAKDLSDHEYIMLEDAVDDAEQLSAEMKKSGSGNMQSVLKYVSKIVEKLKYGIEKIGIYGQCRAAKLLLRLLGFMLIQYAATAATNIAFIQALSIIVNGSNSIHAFMIPKLKQVIIPHAAGVLAIGLTLTKSRAKAMRKTDAKGRPLKYPAKNFKYKDKEAIESLISAYETAVNTLNSRKSQFNLIGSKNIDRWVKIYQDRIDELKDNLEKVSNTNTQNENTNTQEDIMFDKVQLMIESSVDLSLNGVVVDSYILTENAAGDDELEDYLPIFEATEILIEANVKFFKDNEKIKAFGDKVKAKATAAKDKLAAFGKKIKEFIDRIIEGIKNTKAAKQVLAWGVAIQNMFKSIFKKKKEAEEAVKEAETTEEKVEKKEEVKFFAQMADKIKNSAIWKSVSEKYKSMTGKKLESEIGTAENPTSAS